MGDISNDEFRCLVSKSALNPLRYGSRQARPRLDAEGRININQLIGHLHDLRRFPATKDLIIHINNSDNT